MFGFDWVVVAIVVLIILVLIAGVKTVPQGYNYTIQRFGRFTRTLKPGLNIIVPFIDRIGWKMNMTEQVLDVPTQEVITRDNATVSADGITFYQIIDAPRAAYEVTGLQNALLRHHHDQHPHRARRHGPRRGAVEARRDQRQAAHRGRCGGGRLGRQGDPDRDQGHLAAARPRRRHGPADEGRAREARPDPRGGGRAGVADPQVGGREAGPDPPGRGPARGRLPRRRGARAARRGGGEGDDHGVGGGRQGRRAGAQLFRRPEIHPGARGHRQRARPARADAADRGVAR